MYREFNLSRTNFTYFFRCRICNEATTCNHFQDIIIEATVKKEERRPTYKCFICPENNKSAKKLFSHLMDDHAISVKYRCRECKATRFRSFKHVTSHQQFCQNPIPELVPKQPRPSSSESRPFIGNGLLWDICDIRDDQFRVTAIKVLFRQASIDALLQEFNRLTGRTPKRLRRSRPRGPNPEAEQELWPRDKKKIWKNMIHGAVNPDLDVDIAFNHFNELFGTRSENTLLPMQVNPPNSISCSEYVTEEDIHRSLQGKMDSTPDLTP